MNTDTITLTGHVGTEPRHLISNDGLPITSFRVATNPRRYDSDTNEWVAGETNWYTVTCFRELAIHTARSISKGDAVIVGGTLHVREWEKDDRKGTSVEVDAQSIGLDLRFGVSIFTRTTSKDDEEKMPS